MPGDIAFIGIDPTAGVRHSTVAILDSRLKVVKLQNTSLDAIFEMVNAYPAAICAIDAPIAPSKGLMADKDYRRRLGLEPGSSSYSNYRVGEYELRRRGITLYNTPVDSKLAKKWMQEGWKLYDRLREAGFGEYPRASPRRLFETYPHAGFTALVGRRPYPKTSVRGLLQRQLVLYDEGLDLPDPMHNLEEWTRHRIMTGQLTYDGLYNHDQLDALMAAYTAFKAEKEPHQVNLVGDPAEGQIVVPVAALKDAY
jgi:hypothetical protein